MKEYEGIIEDIGYLGKRSGQGGKITFIKINKQILRNVGCPDDVYDFMHRGMNVTMYVHTMPILGKVILGVRDRKDGIKFMAGTIGVIASCIMAILVLAVVLAIPGWLIGMQLNAVMPTMIFLCLVMPAIASVMLFMSYLKAQGE